MPQPGILGRTKALQQAGRGSTSGLLRDFRLRHMQKKICNMYAAAKGLKVLFWVVFRFQPANKLPFNAEGTSSTSDPLVDARVARAMEVRT